jgi:hypothetical protein
VALGAPVVSEYPGEYSTTRTDVTQVPDLRRGVAMRPGSVVTSAVDQSLTRKGMPTSSLRPLVGGAAGPMACVPAVIATSPLVRPTGSTCSQDTEESAGASNDFPVVAHQPPAGRGPPCAQGSVRSAVRGELVVGDDRHLFSRGKPACHAPETRG